MQHAWSTRFLAALHHKSKGTCVLVGVYVGAWERRRGIMFGSHRRTNQLSMHGPYLDPTSLGLLHNELLHGTLWVAGPLLGPGSTQAHAARKVGRLRPQLNEARDRWARGLSICTRMSHQRKSQACAAACCASGLHATGLWVMQVWAKHKPVHWASHAGAHRHTAVSFQQVRVPSQKHQTQMGHCSHMQDSRFIQQQTLTCG